MATKQEMEALWASLSRRLASDPKLAGVVESLEKSIDSAVDDTPRRRLKAPYANATTLDTGSAWN